MRVGIAGVSGRVGRLLAETVVCRGHTLAGGIGRPGTTNEHRRFGDIVGLATVVDIVIDFSHPATTVANAAGLAEAGVPWVLGTTGLDKGAQEAVEIASRRIAVVQAANFSPCIVLMTALARRLAEALPEDEYDAEILEMHHRGKRDAPSGTALELGRVVALGRAHDLAAIAVRGRDGETGPRRSGTIGFAVQRGGAIVGEHALSFTGTSERITLSHEAFDRRVFAEGALRAACWLLGKPAGHYTMADVMGVDPRP